MLSGLSHCFSFIAHVMAHKLIPKGDLPDDSLSKKKKEGKRKRHSLWGLGLVKAIKKRCFGKVKDKTRGNERVVCALSLTEIFSSILPGRAGVSVMPNLVIKGINLRQELICCTHHDIFITYYHSVMNPLITSDMHYMDQPSTYEVTIYVIKSSFIVFSYGM